MMEIKRPKIFFESDLEFCYSESVNWRFEW